MSNQEAESVHSSETFLTLHPFMWRILGLKGTQLLVFGRIYGFCKGGGSYFESRRNAARYLNVSERSVIRSIAELSANGLIEETEPTWHLDGISTRNYVIPQKILELEKNSARDKMSPPDKAEIKRTTKGDNLTSEPVTACHLIKKEDNKYFK